MNLNRREALALFCAGAAGGLCHRESSFSYFFTARRRNQRLTGAAARPVTAPVAANTQPAGFQMFATTNVNRSGAATAPSAALR